jgi:predicted deacylase
MSTPRSFEFESGRLGPKLLVFGAVHGNETCGAIALSRLKMELDLGLLELQCGLLTLVPVCNPLAYKAGKRFVEQNLNRIFSRAIAPTFDEAAFADTLMDLIDECDILLDLHSYSCGKGPFITLDYPTPPNRILAAAQGVPDWVTGWPEIYEATPGLNAGDSTQYANETGKTGILVECGQHADPAAIDVAYACIRRTLAHLGMMEIGRFGSDPLQERVLRFTGIVTHDRPGAFARPWQTLDRVEAGEPLIRYEDGTVLSATEPSVIILPDPIAPPGAEWLYLAKDV